MPPRASQIPVNPILIGDLPVAKDEALSTFEVLPDSTYQFASLGKAHGLDEGAACDCHFVPGMSTSLSRGTLDGAPTSSREYHPDCTYLMLIPIGRSRPYEACGDGANCINRLTLVECEAKDCPSRSHCQNRRQVQ